MASLEEKKRSQQILGGRSKDERVAFARNAMTTFERTWGAIRLVSENHPSRSQFLQLFLNAAKCYTEQFGALVMEVGSHAFSIDGQEILRIDRPNDNYIYRLYQDGIRRLVFGEDLSIEELERFLRVLLVNFSERRFTEDNIVTLLWEAGLESIIYTAIETFVEAPAEEDSSGAKQRLNLAQDPTNLKQTVNVDSIIERALRAPKISNASTDVSRQAKKSAGLYVEQTRGQTPKLLERVSEETDERVVRPIHPAPALAVELGEQMRASAATLGTKFGEITFYAVQTLEAPAAEPVLKAFGDFALTCVMSQSEEPLVEALTAVDKLSAAFEDRNARQRILEKLEDPQIVELLVARLTGPRVRDGVMKLFQLVSADLFPRLWERMLEIAEAPHKAVLRDSLVPFAKYHGRFLLEKLSHSDAVIAAEALFMLQRMDFTRTVKDLVVGLGHPSPAVRIEVARTLQLIDDPVARQVLLPHLLKDPDEEVRLAGIRILVQLGGPSLEDTLIGSLQQADFILRGGKEKTLMMAALGRVATTKCLAVVRDLALGSGPIGAPIDRDTQMAALRLVGRVGGSEEVPALEKIAGKFFGGRELKDAARQAIESIRRRNERQ